MMQRRKDLLHSMSNNSEDSDESSPTPLIDPKDGDDDDPPAAGAVTIEVEDEPIEVSLAPTAEPMHKANPMKVTA